MLFTFSATNWISISGSSDSEDNDKLDPTFDPSSFEDSEEDDEDGPNMVPSDPYQMHYGIVGGINALLNDISEVNLTDLVDQQKWNF